MGFRIMQLQYETGERKIHIKEGITLRRPFHMADIGFSKIQSMYTPPHDLEVSKIHEYVIDDDEDGYKTLRITPVIEEEVILEAAIILIVYYADDIKTSSKVKKIAGRYFYEGIFILKPNDKIIVKKGSMTEKFAAVHFEKKMYLIKLRD